MGLIRSKGFKDPKELKTFGDENFDLFNKDVLEAYRRQHGGN